MFRRSTRLHAPALLIAALAALLVFAAGASAETRTGESSSALSEGTPSAEATLVKSAVSYETTSGDVVFNVTTAAPPQATDESDEESQASTLLGLFKAPGECNSGGGTFQSLLFSASPPLLIESENAEPFAAEAVLGSPAGGSLIDLGPVAKSVAGATTTLSISSGTLAEKSFDCAVVFSSGGEGGSLMGFPIKAVPAAPPAPVTEAASGPAPAAAASPAPPRPPVLSIGKSKPLKLKVGKSRTIRVKVSNSGATATAPGSLRVKVPAGIIVKPERQQLPILAPGGSFTLSVRVELTAKAKQKSTISLTGTASDVTAKSSVVVKRAE
jgi:hypothetical protein